MTVLVPAGQTLAIPFEQGLRFTAGIGYGMTALMPVADTTAVAAGDLSLHISYI
jgi:hypothetical protein